MSFWIILQNLNLWWIFNAAVRRYNVIAYDVITVDVITLDVIKNRPGTDKTKESKICYIIMNEGLIIPLLLWHSGRRKS